MSWYTTEDKAWEAAHRKERIFEEEYTVVKDEEMPKCYVATKKKTEE